MCTLRRVLSWYISSQLPLDKWQRKVASCNDLKSTKTACCIRSKLYSSHKGVWECVSTGDGHVNTQGLGKQQYAVTSMKSLKPVWFKHPCTFVLYYDIHTSTHILRP